MKPGSPLKNQLRNSLKVRRQALDEAQRAQKDREIRQNLMALPEIQLARSIFCFVSNSTEVDTHALITQLMDQSKQLSVPKIVGEGPMQAVVFNDWKDLETAQLGILSPRNTHPLATDIDITLTPGLGFSPKGARLGYGRGYYDRWFSEHGGGLKIGLAYEMQIVEEVPTDENDIQVDLIVTEERVISTTS